MSHLCRVGGSLSFRTASSSIRSSRSGLCRRYKSAPTIESTSKEKTTEAATSGVPIVKSLVAALLGMGTVSATAALVENSTSSNVPKFDPKGQRFDETKFIGRFSRMLLACDPRLLFYSEEQVRQAQSMLQNYQQYDESMDRALWEAKRIVDAALHPDTGDVIPKPFRMSG